MPRRPPTETWSKCANAAASAVALVAGVVCMWKKRRSHSRSAPGPPGFPIVGHAQGFLIVGHAPFCLSWCPR
ncbi:hypothetical protein DUNSADRAFT_7649 [Dunaliella salina]|uniref:Encoded protein n=1 Tax=Dunaliella salina TaxID=3046 RepID=A0ABQ7H650_DUNSA|nr:hypothetical protein DUNSADRAFT_7649 [Dunaliella salina]|eukprot:KAF5842335.1 hypothetical protein DUNSADRAFT_7649 [Dunaliella salina]